MIHTRISALGMACGTLGVTILCSGLYAGDLSRYRGLQFGMNLSAASKDAGTQSAEAKLIHERPALIQEMDWQPRSVMAESANPDPVKQGVLSFFNGELFRIIITYDRYKIEGMTTEDMVDAISATYGRATRPTAEILYHSNYAEVATVIARWEDPEYSFNLVRTGDQASFAMVLYSKRLDALAQVAIVEAVRLDAKEAPQRDLEKQADREAAEHNVREKARSVNKPNFRP